MKTSGAFKGLRLICLLTVLGLMGHAAPAHAGLAVVKGEGPGAIRLTIANPSGSACGAEVNLGDGKTERKRLEPGEQWQLQHAFSADGNFTVAVTGVTVFRGLRSAGPCELRQQVGVTVAGGQASVAPPAAAAEGAPARAAATAPPAAPTTDTAQARSAPPPSPGESADLVLFHRRTSDAFRFVTAIDGSKRLDSADRLVSGGYQLCYLLFPDAYNALGSGADAQRLLDGEVSRTINALAGNRQVRSSRVECVRGGQFVGAAFTDVVAVQRRVLPNLSALREFSGFEQFAVVGYDALAQLAARRQQAAAQRQQDVATWSAEISALAAANSTEKLGSLTLSTPQSERESVKACTLEYAGPQGQAVIAYGNGLIPYTSPAFRIQAAEKGATFNANQPYSSVYKSLDDFYLDHQKDPRKCHVFVDFPKNLRTLMTALERDRKDAAFEINSLVPTIELREAWARKQGYDNLAASEFAAQIRGNAGTLKSLAAKGIQDKAGYDSAVDAMRAAKYSESSSVAELLAYLEDKAAAEKRGVTAAAIREERISAQRAESERRAQEEQRARAEYAREFPYTATLTCGVNDRHINIMACMSGRNSLKSELELANGSQYKMYQPWEVRQAGRETAEGVVIPLRSNYKIRLRNVDETLILSLKVVANATGRVVYNRSASRFGSVYHEN